MYFILVTTSALHILISAGILKCGDCLMQRMNENNPGCGSVSFQGAVCSVSHHNLLHKFQLLLHNTCRVFKKPIEYCPEKNEF